MDNRKRPIFINIPEELLNADWSTKADIKIYWALFYTINILKYRICTDKQLAGKTGLSIRQIKRSLAALKKHNWLRVIEKRRQIDGYDLNVYWIYESPIYVPHLKHHGNI